MTYSAIREEFLVTIIALCICDGSSYNVLQCCFQIRRIARLENHHSALASRSQLIVETRKQSA